MGDNKLDQPKSSGKNPMGLPGNWGADGLRNLNAKEFKDAEELGKQARASKAADK